MIHLLPWIRDGGRIVWKQNFCVRYFVAFAPDVNAFEVTEKDFDIVFTLFE